MLEWRMIASLQPLPLYSVSFPRPPSHTQALTRHTTPHANHGLQGNAVPVQPSGESMNESSSSSGTRGQHISRSFTTGMAAPMRATSPLRGSGPSMSLARPSSPRKHVRNVSQPSCFDQLDPFS